MKWKKREWWGKGCGMGWFKRPRKTPNGTGKCKWWMANRYNKDFVTVLCSKFASCFHLLFVLCWIVLFSVIWSPFWVILSPFLATFSWNYSTERMHEWPAFKLRLWLFVRLKIKNMMVITFNINTYLLE